MNDLEIALWSLIIESNLKDWDEFDLPINLLSTGFQSKV